MAAAAAAEFLSKIGFHRGLGAIDRGRCSCESGALTSGREGVVMVVVELPVYNPLGRLSIHYLRRIMSECNGAAFGYKILAIHSSQSEINLALILDQGLKTQSSTHRSFDREQR